MYSFKTYLKSNKPNYLLAIFILYVFYIICLILDIKTESIKLYLKIFKNNYNYNLKSTICRSAILCWLIRSLNTFHDG